MTVRTERQSRIIKAACKYMITGERISCTKQLHNLVVLLVDEGLLRTTSARSETKVPYVVRTRYPANHEARALHVAAGASCAPERPFRFSGRQPTTKRNEHAGRRGVGVGHGCHFVRRRSCGGAQTTQASRACSPSCRAASA